MATRTSINESDTITDEQEYGIRLQLLREKLNKVLRNHFHKHFNRDPHKLYLELNQNRKQINKLRQGKKCKISSEQYELLLPEKGFKSFSNKYDTSLLVNLLFELCGFERPQYSWKPADDDYSEIANFVRIKNGRNRIQHCPVSVSRQIFETIYNSMEQPLLDLGLSPEEYASIRTKKVVGTVSKKKIKKMEESQHAFNYNYIPPIPNFTGRKEKISQIHTCLINSCSDILSNNILGVVISGMVGVGKTEVARKYWLKFHKSYYEDSIIWINAQNNDTMEMAFREVAEQTGYDIKNKDGAYKPIKEVISTVYEHFAKRSDYTEPERKVLFVFDNLNDPNEIVSFLPSINVAPYILITSQCSTWDPRFTLIDLDVFSKETAKTFLLNNTDKFQIMNENANCAFLYELERHPLAIQQALSYIKINQMTVEQYLSLFRERGKELLAEANATISCKPVLTTFSLTVNLFKNKLGRSQIPIDILNAMAYLDGKNIKKGFLLKLVNNDVCTLNNALALLRTCSLINTPKHSQHVHFNEQVVTIHSLIQLTIKYRHEETEERKQTLDKIFDIFFQDLLEHEQNNRRIDMGKYWFQHYLYMYNKPDTKEHLLFRSLNYQILILNMFETKGNLDRFLELLQSLEQTCVNDRQLWSTQNNIAQTLSRSGYYKEALAIHRKVEAAELQSLGPDHHSLLKTQQNIAQSLSKIGNFTDSLDVYQKVFIKQRQILPEDHTDLLGTQHNMANTLSNAGRFEEAIKIYKRIETIEIRKLGPLHPHLLTTQHNYAHTLSKICKFEEALKIYKKVEMCRLQTLGPNHREVLTTKHNIAYTLSQLGQFQEALGIYKQIEAIELEQLGPGHPVFLTTQNNIAYILSQTGKFKEALYIHKMIEKGRSQLKDPYNLDLLITQHNIAYTYSRAGQFSKALATYKQVEAVRKRKLNPEHPTLLTTQHNVAHTLTQLGRFKEALEIYKTVEVARLRTLGPLHPSVITTQHNLADAFVEIGQFKEAIKIYKKIESAELQTLGLHHPDLLTTQHAIAQNHSKINQFQEALTIYKEVEAVELEILYCTDPSLLITQYNIAHTLSQLGRFRESLKVYLQVEAITRQQLGSKHQDLLLKIQRNIKLCKSKLKHCSFSVLFSFAALYFVSFYSHL